MIVHRGGDGYICLVRGIVDEPFSFLHRYHRTSYVVFAGLCGVIAWTALGRPSAFYLHHQ
eukprot:15463219-Alexandrium_andersonii.AAC.1